MIPSLEGWPTKAKEAPSPHEVRLAPLDTNPVFHSLGTTQYFIVNPVFQPTNPVFHSLGDLVFEIEEF